MHVILCLPFNRKFPKFRDENQTEWKLMVTIFVFWKIWVNLVWLSCSPEILETAIHNWKFPEMKSGILG